MSFLIQTAPAGLASRDQKEAEIRSALFLSGRVARMIWGPIDNSTAIPDDSPLASKIKSAFYDGNDDFFGINVTNVES